MNTVNWILAGIMIFILVLPMFMNHPDTDSWEKIGPLIDRVISEEGACITLTGSNPDFNGLPNEVITVVRGPAWEEETFRGDTLTECLEKALALKDN